MTKTPVKFQKDQHKTVGVVDTRYLLLKGETEPRKAEYHVPSLFFKKAEDNKKIYILSEKSIATLDCFPIY